MVRYASGTNAFIVGIAIALVDIKSGRVGTIVSTVISITRVLDSLSLTLQRQGRVEYDDRKV